MARQADSDIVWAGYARLSRLKSHGKGRPRRGRHRNADESVERQKALIRAHAAERGLNLPEHLIFTDNGLTGWQKPGGAPPFRPEWDRMIKAGKAGDFGGLLAWKIDRFTRNPRDGEDLADLRVLLDGPGSGRIDLRTADGLSHFRKQVEAAAHASHETSEKVSDKFADMRAAGYRIGGAGRTFGFEILSETDLSDWDWDDDSDERLVGPAAVIRADEAEIIRDLARRLLAGEFSQQMCDDLNGRTPPVTTTRGGPWLPSTLCRMLGNPLYGGWLAYKGERVARLANTEAILDEATFEAVQAKLAARKRGPKTSGRYPLSGVLICGNPACPRSGHTMTGFTGGSSGSRSYCCALTERVIGGQRVKGCGQSVIAKPVEDMTRDRVVAELANAATRERVRAADAYVDDKRAELSGLLEDIDKDMAEIEHKRSQTRRSQTRLREEYDRNMATLSARYEAIERERDELGPASAPENSLEPLTAEQWDLDTPAAEKARIIGKLGLRITILPSVRPQGSSRRAFDTGRVQIDP